MSSAMPNCRITVLKRIINQDLIGEYVEDAHTGIGPCECFEEGQAFVIDPSVPPEEFRARCMWAWADICGDILTASYRGDMPGMRQRETLITGCTDWLRPVIFRVERIQ